VFGIESLQAASTLLARLKEGGDPPPWIDETAPTPAALEGPWGDLADIKGQSTLRRALEVAAAGRHHLLLFGPPGSGKTMAARRLPSLLPDLTWGESLAVTRIHSVAGVLPPESGLVTRPPVRMPHHSASSEGVVGGGGVPRPGEVSLAHEGVLILDEAAEFRLQLLQSLREPMEAGQITIARAGLSVRFPACSQLVFTTNPCPCGNLGRKNAVCVCSHQEIARYWKRLGGALLDRVDIRVPLVPLDAATISGPPGESSREVLERVCRAVQRQRSRYAGLPFSRNGWLPPAAVEQFCPLGPEAAGKLAEATEELALSSRAHQSVRKVARTLADLEGSPEIRAAHVLEAVQHRRFGGTNLYWSFA
jgi:magnesium chelatase family protein